MCQESDKKGVLEFCNLCFLGTSVESGVAEAVVLSTGKNTYLGSIASDINKNDHVSDFNKELKKFVFFTFIPNLKTQLYNLNSQNMFP